MPRRLLTAALAAALLTWSGGAQAQVLLDTGLGNRTTSRGSGNGPGQGISVSTATNLNRVGFWLGSGGGNVKFMIWDDTNTSLLFTQVISVGAIADGTLVLSDPFSFALSAGSTYHFGVLSDQSLRVSYFDPHPNTSQNGLTLSGANTNYTNYSNPTLSSQAAAQIALQLHGTQGQQGVVPEPVTMVLLGSGLLGVGVARHRRRGKQSS